ncbi:SIMPL domain-containing protein [bacterium]|nr:SIMPL domain-containing protein [bacterium]
MADMKDNNGGLFLLALGIVAASFILGNKLVEMRKAGDMISVTGSAKRPIVSDLIQWNGSVSASDDTQQKAYAAVKAYGERVAQFCRENGVIESELSMKPAITEQIQEYTNNGYTTGKILGFRVYLNFVVSSSRVEVIEEVIKRSDQLISEGVPLTAYGAQYLYTKLADMRIEMLGDAMKDALARAKVLAESSDSELGDLRDARMGVFQVTPRNSTDVSDYGYYDTSSKEKDITAVVKASYSLD